MTRPVGTLAIVLHTHLPWLAHHGTWPVGEEWLHQAWAGSYLPLVEVLHRLGQEGRGDLLSLGVTPVLAAQLDDPYCLREHHGWLGRWQLRAQELAECREPHLRELASHEFRAAADALRTFETRWVHGGSAALRPLVDAGVVELLGGPATHPVLPLLPAPVARLAVRSGLDDTAIRLGHRPGGLWVPECAVTPQLPALLAREGVRHVMVEEATLRSAGASTDRVWSADGVAVVGRDLELTDRVWSARSGYPRGAEYRDFHTFDHASGFRVARVTDPDRADKRPYEPALAAVRARRDAVAFVSAARDRLLARTAAGEQPLVVCAWDTELFGHWWHEGPHFLEQVLRLLPEAGVRPASLETVVAEHGGASRPLALPVGSWGAGKDLHLWSGERVRDLAREARSAADRLLHVVRRHARATERSPAMDALARATLLTVASDWAFMVSRDSAADYARSRHAGHLQEVVRWAEALGSGAVPLHKPELVTTHRVVPHLDARTLLRLEE